ncbi:TIR domain-containing protein [Ruminococcus flavefaciens]|uniref:TIR domain-containing protein n=1 Tax=Ruminococcus flavefaciens TaxID=1265 RepID=UPI0026F3468C|nr:toll/interleukin-1 receptor domain-containing protein [Ruminococcus flavefaciens]
MSFVKLPSNSEKLLFELVQAENPTRLLNEQYNLSKGRAKQELDGIVRELEEYGYIIVNWAGNMPFFVTLNNSARTYSEKLADYERVAIQGAQRNDMKDTVFISHRSTDKDVVDMLLDFFSRTEIPSNRIFCSSLPGNDINEKISAEVKENLKNSLVNIVILSQDYYQSAYCLNEAGILWYEDTTVIPIALPEIDSNNMYGFLNNEYKLRRLNCDTDISYIYDTLTSALSVERAKTTVFTKESKKLIERYSEYIQSRGISQIDCSNSLSISKITTDDERIVLYYILQKSVRKITKTDITRWLNENEIYDVDIDNAFDLLSSFEGGKINNDALEFGFDLFRKYTADSSSILPILKACVDNHIKLALDTFKAIWVSNSIDEVIMLFIAYIIDERICAFGNRWLADSQVESIKHWEEKCSLDSTLSSNYGSCLEFFVQNNLVYASGWTSYGNAREYTLCPSLQAHLFSCPEYIADKLNEVKEKFICELPF